MSSERIARPTKLGRPTKLARPNWLTLSRGGWGISLRMARRDVRRYKGRSALIVVMVGLPAFLLVLGIVLSYTSRVTGAEKIPAQLGSSAAYVERRTTDAYEQDYDSTDRIGMSGKALVPPGWDDSSFQAQTAALSTLVDRVVIPIQSERVGVIVGERRISLESLVVDGRENLGSKVRLIEGRWPTNSSEVLLTSQAHERGVDSTTIKIAGRTAAEAASPEGAGPDDTAPEKAAATTVAVVGTVDAYNGLGQPVDMVSLTPQGAASSSGWLVLGDDVTWRDVRELNTYGFLALSAAALRDPPPDSQLTSSAPLNRINNSRGEGMVMILAGVMLLVATCLMVGPAFAVSAARSRRTLAITASNGATSSQLRSSVLAQGVVLGAGAAVLGGLAGVITAYLIQGRLFYSRVSNPFDPALRPVAMIVAVASASALIAALLPARRLNSLDLVGVIKGQHVSPRPSWLVFGTGLVLTTSSAASLIYLVQNWATEVTITAAVVALMVGAVLLCPMVLAGLSRLGRGMPLALRMATRDAGRQRARTAPSIAAVMAGAAVLTTVLIASGSDEKENQLKYVPSTLPGEIATNGIEVPAEGVARADPTLVATQTWRLSEGDASQSGSAADQGEGSVAQTPVTHTDITIVPPGCTVATVRRDLPRDEGSTLSEGCDLSMVGSSTDVQIIPREEVARRLEVVGLGEAARAVRAGGAVIGQIAAQPPQTRDGKATFAITKTRLTVGEDASGAVEDLGAQTVDIAAVEVPFNARTAGLFAGGKYLVPAEFATEAQWSLSPATTLIHSRSGPITEPQAERLSAKLNYDLSVEDGFSSARRWVIAAVIGIFSLLLLVITLSSVALSITEQQSDQATLAAVGAGRSFRRRTSAAQAWLLASVGAVMGVGIGLVPGVAFAFPLTRSAMDPYAVPKEVSQNGGGDAIVAIPWGWLVVIAIAVPLVAATLAAAGIRNAPDATQRTA